MNSGVAQARPNRQRQTIDLIQTPVPGRFLRWKHARTALQIPMLALAALIVLDGLIGPSLAAKNIAGVLPWVHWRGLVVLGLLVVGNLFCMACPFMLPRKLGKKIFPASASWPSWLPGKWLAIGLLIIYFWSYEAFDLWSSPWWTAWVVIGYFGLAFTVDAFFKGAAFCKHVCPIGQFNFVNSLVSPFEIKIRNANACASCTTKDCISGRKAPESGNLLQSGCELWLFQERKSGNMDCTFCLDCVHACPYDNVGMILRNPVNELDRDPRRSGVGRFGDRTDLALLALIMVAAAFLNAFGMVGPVFRFERWLATTLGINSEPVVLAIVFIAGLIVIPALLVTYAAYMSKLLARSDQPLAYLTRRYIYALVPLGFGMWIAHYGFHFFTGALTIIPVGQTFLADIGISGLGEPRWDLAELMSVQVIDWFELLILELGLIVTVYAAYRVSLNLFEDRGIAFRATIPWAILSIGLFAIGFWLMSQPMEMRGTIFGG